MRHAVTTRTSSEPNDVAPQATAPSSDAAADGLASLVADHRELARSFHELAGATDPLAAKQRLIHMRQAICLHADAEAVALSYLGSRSTGGRERWRSWRRAYRRVEKLLAEIDRRSISSPDLPELIEDVIVEVQRLIGEQETVTFPLLRSTLSPAEQAEVARRVLVARQRGDTRPHPHLLHRGALSWALRASLAPVDRLRDRMVPRL